MTEAPFEQEPSVADVDFAAAWSMLDFVKTVEARARNHHEAAFYEIPDGSEVHEAKWYLVQTAPGCDARAIAGLVRRRFGVFRPVQQQEGPDPVLEPTFPGWLFVLCREIWNMEDRIRAVSGVVGFLCYPGTLSPCPVEDAFIDTLRARSWSSRAARHAAISRRAAVKMSGKDRKQLARLTERAKRELVWDASTWDSANRLDPRRRLALLKHCLGVGSPSQVIQEQGLDHKSSGSSGRDGAIDSAAMS